MIDSIELRREDWEKLQKYHEVLANLLLETENFLNSLLQIGGYPPLKPQAEELHRRMEPLSRFLNVVDSPFGITDLSKR